MKNVRNVCENCMIEKQKSFQKEKIKSLHIGDFCKLKIEDCNGIDFMWFEVINFKDDFIFGLLKNIPQRVKCINFNEEKMFRVSEVVDYMPITEMKIIEKKLIQEK